jgi:pyruvate dehydrogenase E1 component alpha subunit
MYRSRLESAGIPAESLEELETEAVRLVDKATAAAEAADPPEASLVETDVWADGGSAWRN